MKFPRQLIGIAVVFGFVVSSHGEPLEFSGYIASGTGTKFLLTDIEDGTRSGWLNIGSSFRGYMLTRFDRENKSVSLRKDTETLQLPLKPSKTGDVEAAFLEDKTLSVSDDGDFFVGDFPVDTATLTELIRAVMRAQPEGLVELRLSWTRPEDRPQR